MWPLSQAPGEILPVEQIEVDGSEAIGRHTKQRSATGGVR
jgi:hypothetical protein